MGIEYHLNFNDRMEFRDRMNFFVFLVLFLTPFIYIPNPINYSCLPKFIFLIFITAVISGVMFLKKDKESQPGTWEDKLLLTYIILLIFSTIFSYNLEYSLLGYSTRYEGLLAVLIYIFMFLLAYRNFRFDERYFRIFVIGATILSLYGASQYFGFDPVPKTWARVVFKGRGHSTFGNPNFLGTYLTLLLPIAVYSYIKSGKWIYLLAAGSIYLSLITSFTRSGWLGSLVGVIVLLVYFLKLNYNKKYLATIIGLFLIITVVMEIQSDGRVITRMLSITEDAERFLTQAEGYEDAGANRIFIWRRIIPMIKERPFLGFGLETLGVVFSERHMDEVVAEYGRGIIFDKAHNEYLHIAYSTGIPSLLIYLAFVWSIIGRAFKNVKDNHMIVPLIAAIIGYLVQAFFNLSVVTVAYIYWIFLGILLRISLYPDDVGLKITSPDGEI